jgi:hypothetical protein
MNGTLNKVMLIGYLGDDVKCIILMVETVLVDFNWLQMKFISTKLRMKNIIYRVA